MEDPSHYEFLKISIVICFPLKTLWVHTTRLGSLVFFCFGICTPQQSPTTRARHEVKYTPAPRGPETHTALLQLVFDPPHSCITDTRHHLAFDSTDSYASCQPRRLQVSLLSGLFWFTEGGGFCAHPPPTPTSRFADLITLAFPGETPCQMLQM